eukprot:TRINITY_DN6120_c0_g1_i2.p1 TRINITY_DN6120_c0_g1~~TRINITY_DN6120_c0_g1_i2.p1  ORF type:complete len:132 (-),score=28.72 TRINITY_DN6120_c0_g1_i2:57-452(-)
MMIGRCRAASKRIRQRRGIKVSQRSYHCSSPNLIEYISRENLTKDGIPSEAPSEIPRKAGNRPRKKQADGYYALYSNFFNVHRSYDTSPFKTTPYLEFARTVPRSRDRGTKPKRVVPEQKKGEISISAHLI